MLLQNKKNMVFLIPLIALTACGGGGGGGDTVSPTVEKTVSFNATATAITGGSISPSSVNVVSGSTATFTITANDTYETSNVTGCGGTLTGNTYVTNVMTQDCQVSATFSLIIIDGNEAPSAKVLFPGKTSRANGSQITIKGTANDADGVKAVRVNGNLATLTTASAQIANTTSKSSIVKTSNKNDTSINWEITVESEKDQEIIIETEDSSGNIDKQAEVINILNEVIPSNFTIDYENNRLIGQLAKNTFGVLDLSSKQTSTFTTTGIEDYGLFTYYENTDRLIYSELFNSNLRVLSINPLTGQTEVLLNHDLALDAAVWSFAQVKSIDIGPSKDELFILLKYFHVANYDENKSLSLKIDLATNLITPIFDNKTTSDNKISTDFMAFTENGLLVFNDIWGGNDDGISLVELDGSDSSSLSNTLGLLSSRIDVDHENKIAYTSGFDGFSAINLTTGDHEVLSLDSDEEELAISQIRSTGLDLDNNQLLVSDSDLDLIMAIDLTTGSRTKYASNGVGEGHLIISPRELTLDQENNIAYIADDGSNAPEFILKIDLNTGDRTKLITFANEFNYNFSGLSLDSVTNSLYTIINDELIEVNIDDASFNVISSSHVGSGILFDSIQEATLDSSNHRVLAADPLEETLLAINTEDGHRTIISSSNSGNEVGTGESIYGISAITLDEENQLAYVASQFNKNIVKIDLVTGNRSLVLNSCNGTAFTDTGLNNISYNKQNNSLLFSNNTVIKYSIDDEICEQSSISSDLDVEENQNGQVYMTGVNTLYQIELATNEKVIISK